MRDEFNANGPVLEYALDRSLWGRILASRFIDGSKWPNDERLDAVHRDMYLAVAAVQSQNARNYVVLTYLLQDYLLLLERSQEARNEAASV
ncbi:hypothetical protein EPA93_00225 [Ktedonosporobacter rubrisoli]|uniref:Uncharacterized protein n=1 Tax=Ktedonosporobacter rubrisoli TaxID=2509675 RepID=A0A4P6JHT3_KTERU|nr:hypothetical protein [Ktedonosporobacter rubrisoli]QBD74503.1 hypothetical protein EPA93_00225 [Ktedonosporobacter rubrisoli]